MARFRVSVLYAVAAGDGAGLLVSLPDQFFAEVVKSECGVELPAQGEYAVGQVFMPQEPEEYEEAKTIIAR